MNEELIEERVTEDVTQQTESPGIDAQNCVLMGLKFQGWDSTNGRLYDPKSCTHRSEVEKFVGVKVNLNHAQVRHGNKVESRFGRVVKAYARDDGIYGDMKFNPEHPHAKTILWFAKNDPNAIGMSPDAQAVCVKGTSPLKVIGWSRVDSVDIVGDPATTKGLREAMGDEEPAVPNTNVQQTGELNDGSDDLELEEPQQEEDEAETALAELARAVFMSDGIDTKNLCKKLRGLADLLEEIEGNAENDESGDGESPEFNKGDSDKKVEKPVKESKDDVASLKAQLEEYRLKESRRETFEARKASVKQKCVEAKLPAKTITETFIEVLANVDDTMVARLIEDKREAINGAAVVTPTSVGNTNVKLSVDDFVKQLGVTK